MALRRSPQGRSAPSFRFQYTQNPPQIRCGWESLKVFFQETVRVQDPVHGGKEDAVPGAVIAIQSFGDFLGFNPHLHMLCTDGCFYGNGMFRVAPRFTTKTLEEIFRHKVFKMLLSKGKITEDLVDMLMKRWLRKRQGPSTKREFS